MYDEISGEEEQAEGVYYEYELRIYLAEPKMIKIYCSKGASECVVTGTNCCASNADCGERERKRELFAMCGCRCVDVDAIVPMCMSSPVCGGGYGAW